MPDCKHMTELRSGRSCVTWLHSSSFVKGLHRGVVLVFRHIRDAAQLFHDPLVSSVSASCIPLPVP